MIRIAKGDRAYCEAFIQSLKARVSENDRSVEDKVAEILKDVRDNGDEAVRRYTMKFDGWAPEKAEITKEEIDALTADCDPAFIASMERAAENIRAFHARQKQQSRIDPAPTGVLMGQRVRRPAQGRRVCAGRYGSVPVLCFDERHPGENCRSRRDRHGHAAGTYRQAG